MTAFVALLRAVNVGGTGKLPMTTLKAFCEEAGFLKVETYIAGGNVVFESRLGEAKVKTSLEKRLHQHAGKAVAVMVRTADEMAEVVASNPFADRPANRTIAFFLDEPPARDALATATGRKREEFAPGRRELFVFYPDGMGVSRLKIPAAKAGTGRNINTVAKLAAMAAAL